MKELTAASGAASLGELTPVGNAPAEPVARGREELGEGLQPCGPSPARAVLAGTAAHEVGVAVETGG